MTHLLYTTLPTDLPTINKDLLILMAAYYGNIERYARLRRPNRWGRWEISCAVRGIYHNTMIAKWWSLQPGKKPFPIEEAIHARFIMNNDLSQITPDSKFLPYCIWYPSFPHVATCKELVRRVPRSSSSSLTVTSEQTTTAHAASLSTKIAEPHSIISSAVPSVFTAGGVGS